MSSNATKSNHSTIKRKFNFLKDSNTKKKINEMAEDMTIIAQKAFQLIKLDILSSFYHPTNDKIVRIFDQIKKKILNILEVDEKEIKKDVADVKYIKNNSNKDKNKELQQKQNQQTIKHKASRSSPTATVNPLVTLPQFNDNVTAKIATLPLLPYALLSNQTDAIKWLIDSLITIKNVYLGGRSLAELLSNNISNYFHCSNVNHDPSKCPMCLFNTVRNVKDLDLYILHELSFEDTFEQLRQLNINGWEIDWDNTIEEKGGVSIYIIFHLI
jgi:hypothetical protein